MKSKNLFDVYIIIYIFITNISIIIIAFFNILELK